MSAAVIPEPIAELQHQLDEFRSTQPGRRKLPESLWQAAVGLAREHGVHSVARPLGLDYMGLKKRMGGVPRLRQRASKPAFVELIAPQAATLQECVIEFESVRGGRVRIQWKASAAPDWTSLLRAWRETENK